MANIQALAPHVATSSFGQIVMDTISDLAARRKLRALYRDTYRQLSAMSDVTLDDIGLSRGMIHDAALTSARAHL